MAELADLYKELGLSEDEIKGICLPKFSEETRLVLADIGPDGKEKLLSVDAAQNWARLRSKALSDGITLYTYSAYRSFQFQFELIRERIRKGETVQQAIKRLAPPGYSEHHTGRAIDITSPTFPHPSQNFDQSIEFRWLSENAAQFRFFLSYPKGNTSGIMYEPWHWCFR